MADELQDLVSVPAVWQKKDAAEMKMQGEVCRERILKTCSGIAHTFRKVGRSEGKLHLYV